MRSVLCCPGVCRVPECTRSCSIRRVPSMPAVRMLTGLLTVDPLCLCRRSMWRPGAARLPVSAGCGALQRIAAPLLEWKVYVFRPGARSHPTRGLLPDLVGSYVSSRCRHVPKVGDPLTDARALPGGGAVSFGAVVKLKMAVAALVEWGAKRALCGKEEVDVFPLLRAAADVIMMAKESLLDADIRREVCGALAPGTLKALLLRYSPDEFSPESIPQSLITRLEAAESMAGKARSSKSKTVPAPALAYIPVAAEDVGTVWLEEEGFPLDDEGLAATERPVEVLLGAPAPPPSTGSDLRYDALRVAWGILEDA